MAGMCISHQSRHLGGLKTRLGHGKTVYTPFPTVTAAFYHYATCCPENMAIHDLSGSPRSLSYRELALRAQKLTQQLRSRGVLPGQRIPLVVKRSLEMIVGIWAILSCGAQYVPLDGGVVPDETIHRVLDQSQGDIVLCLSSTKHRVTALQPGRTIVVIDELGFASSEMSYLGRGYVDLSTPDDGCYVIYTSGTTGQPKGVDVTHRNVANLVCMSPGNLGITPGTNVGSVLNISFDMAAWEIFACFCNGGTLVIRGSKWEPALQEVDVLICTPTILSKYHPTQFPGIRTVATAGEPTTQSLADLWASHGTYWNCCGPTETTIVNTMQKHIVGDSLSIGRPTPNNNVYIIGEDGECVSVGTPGVMWAGGAGVTRGYVELGDKTAERYLTDRFAKDGSNMYNTGDLGRWRPDGSIEILGRVDDQVKVKGFRVELDGVSASLSSAPGVSRAATLLIEDEIHGFVSPLNCDIDAITKHTEKQQPYYAVPKHIHALDELPATPNGKINKKELQVMALTKSKVQFFEIPLDMEENKGRHLKYQPSLSTLSTVTEKMDLNQDLPPKQASQPFRSLRHRIFIVYRMLFSLVGLINFTILICMIAFNINLEWLGIITAINLTAAVLVRQDMVINGLYNITCSVPKSFPLWIRGRCAKIYHLGGIHSAAGVCATTWLLISTIQNTICDALVCEGQPPSSASTQVVSWLLCGLCCTMVGTAWPSFRKRHHDLFERFHRFAGWAALGFFWLRTILAINDRRLKDHNFGSALVRSAEFWLILIATLSIASSWLSLRRVPVDAEILSEHAVRLHFDYTIPVNGTFTRISQRPLLEWHSFATIPAPSDTHRPKGYSLVVSNAGDWTRNCIRRPPTELWVRGVPTCGVMRIATLFNRIVVIATGSGIGPLLGHINQPTCPTQLIWSTQRPEENFGKEVLCTIRERIPDAVIHDTKLHGRPDLVRMGFNMAQNFGAEAVIVIANEKITKKIVYGLETRGVRAFGAIWDS